MSRAATLRRVLRLGALLALRYAPVPWPLKHRAIWLVEPKVVAVGVAVITDPHGRVLLLRARYAAGRWLLPGGALHAGEDPRQGTLRECREELGLTVTVERLSGIYADPGERIILIAFRCAPLEAPPVLSDEHDAFRYVDAANAPPRLTLILQDALDGETDVRIRTLPTGRMKAEG